MNVGHTNPSQAYLVGPGSTPSFPAFGRAFNAFFYDQSAISDVGNPQFNTANIHVVDDRARIRRVRVPPASIDLWLGGSALRDTVVGLNGAEYRTVAKVGSARGPRCVDNAEIAPGVSEMSVSVPWRQCRCDGGRLRTLVRSARAR
ncbi:MAG: hypothetical protein ACRDL5_09050 [Solirubrobacteraceae bacterium]